MTIHHRNRPPGEVFTRARAITMKPNSFDRATRTFTAVLATDRPVRERGGVMVSLDLASARLPESLPLVLDHKTDVRSMVGRMDNFRVVNGEMVGDGRYSADSSLDWLVERTADNTVTALSAAYRASSVRETGSRSRTVVPEIIHASLVSEPADSAAGIRSADDGDDDDLGAEDQQDTAARNARTRALCRSLGLHDIENRAVDESWSDTRILDAKMERSGSDRIRSTTRGHVSLDDPATYRQAAVDSLVCRITGQEPQGPARDLAGLSWADFHRRHLRQAGQSVAGLSDQEVIMRALATSDLPLIAGEGYNIAMRRTFEASASPSAILAGTRNVPDFRQWTEALTDWTTLGVDKISELGEYRHSYVSEDGEKYSLFTIGGITGISRQVWHNSQGRLGNLSDAQGRRLAADVSDRRVGYITQAALAGPTMRDTNPTFFAARGNIATLNTESIETVIDSLLLARAAMAKRQGAGSVMIGQFPRYWVVPAEFEGVAVRSLATINAARPGDVNPLTGRLEIIVEPRLANTATSYLVCAPATFDGLVQVSLEGSPGPYTESRWGFEVDALQLKIRLDAGFGWLEWRSWTRLDHADLG